MQFHIVAFMHNWEYWLISLIYLLFTLEIKFFIIKYTISSFCTQSSTIYQQPPSIHWFLPIPAKIMNFSTPRSPDLIFSTNQPAFNFFPFLHNFYDKLPIIFTWNQFMIIYTSISVSSAKNRTQGQNSSQLYKFIG